MSAVDTSIFKAYDIRGEYPQQLNEKLAYKIGRAFATLLITENPDQKLTVVISRDMRPSSPALKQEVVRGLTEAGLDVVDIGLATTPTFYFAVSRYGYDGGLQITASHNPAQYNGLKMVRSEAKPIGGGTGMEELRDYVVEENFAKLDRIGQAEQKQGVLKDLITEQTKDINLEEIDPLKIVVDAANSVGSLDMEALFEQLKAELIPMYFELDGTFPNHEADPLKEENLEDIKEKIIETKADLGIAIDGDGDRIFFVDNRGRTMPQAMLRGIMAQIELKEQPEAKVCYDIRPGRITLDLIKQAGGKPIVTRVGHSLIKAKMLEEDAIFGGESSGHYFYQFDYGSFEAPVRLVAKFLHYLSQQEQTLAEIVDELKTYHHSGEINSQVDDKDAVLKQLVEKYSDAKISYLDGVTITYDDYWFNVRPSNTEPKLRLNLEAKTKELMEEKQDEVLAIIRG